MDPTNPSQFLRDMADVVGKLTENAKAQQVKADNAISRLDGIANRHATLQSAALKDLDQRIHDAMDKAVSEAIETIANKLAAANQEAELASDRYKTAGRTIGFRVLILIAMIFIGSIAATEYVIWSKYPSPAEMFMLQRSIDKGALGICPDNKQTMCVHINDQKTKESNWWRLPQ